MCHVWYSIHGIGWIIDESVGVNMVFETKEWVPCSCENASSLFCSKNFYYYYIVAFNDSYPFNGYHNGRDHFITTSNKTICWLKDLNWFSALNLLWCSINSWHRLWLSTVSRDNLISYDVSFPKTVQIANLNIRAKLL